MNNTIINNTIINNTRPSWDKTWLDMLEILKNRSSCVKLKTAASIVKNNQLLATGYNGTFSNQEECYEHWEKEYKNRVLQIPFNEWLETHEFKKLHRDWSIANEIHAEANALKWISRADTSGCILYTLYSPCNACAKDIIAHGIKTVYYRYLYKHGNEAISTLEKLGVYIMQIN